MTAPFRVLWLSRDALGEEQVADLIAEAPYIGEREVQVVAINATYPACSQLALDYLAALAAEHGLGDPTHGCIAAVLPGHIAARVERLRHETDEDGGARLPVGVWLPVSVPGPAQHGEARGGGFVHSHWEAI